LEYLQQTISGSFSAAGGASSSDSPLRRLITRQDCVDAAQALLCKLGGAMRISDASNTTTTTATTSDEEDDLEDCSSSVSINSAYRRHSFDTQSSSLSLSSSGAGRQQSGRHRRKQKRHLLRGGQQRASVPRPALPDSILAHILSFTDPATKLVILEGVPELRDLVFLHSVWRSDLIDLSFLTYDSAVYRRSVLRHGMKLLMRMGRYLRHLRLTVTNDHFYPAARLNHALLRTVIAFCPSVHTLQLVVKWSEDVGGNIEELDSDTDCLLQLLDCLLSRCGGQVRRK
uniref:F-box domain-containing protein n=2 Tax=Macrostomum lignano TaxID=282301 RepID=A0A1I8IUW4_9PLAT